jgi:hypothetical protein
MTTPNDRNRLRTLAAEYAEITNSPVMAERREIWRRTNMLEERTVPFQIEDNGTFFVDVMPPLQCEGGEERGFEYQLLRAITNHRLIPDDRVFPPYCSIGWAIGRTSLCPELSIRRAPDKTGRELGYETNEPMADLAHSMHKLKATEFSVDRDGTLRRLQLAEEAFGDILPSRIMGLDMTYAGTGLAHKAVTFMGMDNFYMAMIDQPEHVHAFFRFLVDDATRFVDWLEAEALITLNNHEYDVGSGSCGLTDELPRRTIAPGDGPLAPGDRVLGTDCWGWIEAQEAIGLSPGMYAEFIYPYQKMMADRLGLVYYGCCEPVHAFWDTIKGMGNVRKVTVSPWCDQEIIAAKVGREVVLSRKPHPMQLCGETFDPKGFTAYNRETLDIAKDNFVELIFRDTCTLSGAMTERVEEACGIIRGLIGRA